MDELREMIMSGKAITSNVTSGFSKKISEIIEEKSKELEINKEPKNIENEDYLRN